MTPDPTRERTVRDDQAHFFADAGETPLLAVDRVDEDIPPTSLWADAWHTLRRRPLFWASGAMILLVLVVALVPQLFTHVDPSLCHLSDQFRKAGPGHPFGFNRQGCDVYSRVIYGARASVTVGVVTTLGVVLLGGLIGAVSGFYGRWLDAILSRIADIFFAVPLLLAAIVVMQVFKDKRDAFTVSIVLIVFGWPQIARIMRGAVMSVKNNDFVTAAKALGLSRGRTLLQHVLPNAAAPVIVTATVSLGIFIVTEATLSFLGIGLSPTTQSWGNDINRAQTSLRLHPDLLFYPGVALALTVLSFIMMGDVVRDALDPKARKR